MKTFIFLCLSVLIGSHLALAKESLDSKDVKVLFDRASSLSIQHSDSSIRLLKTCKEYYELHHSDVDVLECLLLITDLHKVNLNYGEAYENSWEALALADRIHDKTLKSKTYQNVGMLYSYFLQDESAEYLQKALTLDNQLVQSGQVSVQSLISSYYNMALQYIYRSDYGLASTYLDTCFILSDSIKQDKIPRGYLEAEKARLYILDGKFDQAMVLLEKVKDIFESIPEPELILKNNNKSYLVFIYAFIGDMYKGMKDERGAVKYYEKSLSAIEHYQSHKGLSAAIHSNLSKLYEDQKDYQKALIHNKKAKEENDKIFDSRAFSNKKIVQIKNQYKDDIQRKRSQITEQKLEINKKNSTILVNRIVAGFAVLTLILSSILFYFKNQKTKLESEKAILRAETKIKEENTQIMIEMKNKELTSYTLQFIEKDKIISKLLLYFKTNPPKEKSYEKIVQDVKRSENVQWEDFNKRFIEVHKDFYDRLTKLHTNLSATDLKHIAMVKLNFSGKEIAELMGIALNSVHISRHRLRKKLGLERDQNLSSYIHSI